MENFEILKNLVKFNTIKDNENEEIMSYIENYLLKLGFKTESKTKNLVMTIGKNARLGFLGHTDTVEYIKEFKNPFELAIKDEYLYGLGVCDMKGGIAAMLQAISTINFNQLKNGMKLYFTYDEEIGFGGIYELVKNNENFPEFMIFGEPTNNKLLTGGKGLMEYEINFKGKKAHSSNPEKGISANLNAVNFIYELNKFYNNRIKKDIENAYEIPFTTMNIGMIKGGSAKNSIPANCEISIDFRIVKNDHIKLIKNKIEELAKKYIADVNIIEIIEPFLDKIDFIKKIETANFMTEASFINSAKRIILGAGPITAHEVNEHISKESYDKLVKQYQDLIYKIC